jgi:hypothetical protein
MADGRVIRLFVSSPGDIEDELDQLARVVQELNTVLRALVPDKRIVVELVQWKTHVHADMGPPQDVVDRQLDAYEIYLGIMWRRFGTPTAHAGSGTEQEFRAAYKGWDESRSPAHVLFYFCAEPIAPEQLSPDDVEQLALVTAFRNELSHKGLIKWYATHGAFADTVRPELVQVLGELLRPGEQPADVAARAATLPESNLVLIGDRARALAHDYDKLRATTRSGPERTRRMEVIASQMRTLAQSTYALLPELVRSASAGERLVAIATLQAVPDPQYLDWLSDGVLDRQPFIGYHAAVALLSAARTLRVEDLDAVQRAIERAIDGTQRLRPDTDRSVTLRNAHDEVRRRRS